MVDQFAGIEIARVQQETSLLLSELIRQIKNMISPFELLLAKQSWSVTRLRANRKLDNYRKAFRPSGAKDDPLDAEPFRDENPDGSRGPDTDEQELIPTGRPHAESFQPPTGNLAPPKPLCDLRVWLWGNSLPRSQLVPQRSSRPRCRMPCLRS